MLLFTFKTPTCHHYSSYFVFVSIFKRAELPLENKTTPDFSTHRKVSLRILYRTNHVFHSYNIAIMDRS